MPYPTTVALRDRVRRAFDALTMSEQPAPALGESVVDTHPADLRGAAPSRGDFRGTGALRNEIDRIGTEDDVTFWDLLQLKRPLSDGERLAAGRDAVVRRGLALMPEEAISAGWTTKITDERVADPDAVAKTISDYHRRIDTVCKSIEASIAGRQYAHAMVIVIVDDGRPPEEPIDWQNIKTIHGLRVIDRRYYQLGPVAGTKDAATMGTWDHILVTNINGIIPDGLRNPAIFGVDGGPTTTIIDAQPLTRIHRDRLLEFPGPDWLPLIDTARDYLANWWRTNRGMVRGVEEASVSVWSISHWVDKVIGADAAAAIERMRLASRLKSAFSSIVLDKEQEDFKFVQRSLSGLSSMADSPMAAVATAFGYPVMIFWGVDPKGFSTGQPVLDAYEVSKDQWRRRTLEAPLTKLDDMILAAEDGGALMLFGPDGSPDVEAEFVWGDLTPPDETQISQNNQRDATVLLTAVERQVFLAQEVAPKLAAMYGIDLDDEARKTGDADRPDLAVGTAQAALSLTTAIFGEGNIPDASGRALLQQISSRFTPEVSATIIPQGQRALGPSPEAASTPAVDPDTASQIKARKTNALAGAAKAGALDPSVAEPAIRETWGLEQAPEPEPTNAHEDEEIDDDQPPEGDDAVTPQEAAETLRVPTRTITLAIERKQLREYNVLGKRKLSLKAVREFIRAQNATVPDGVSSEET